MKKLRPYQQEALNYSENRNSIALFMEMRLGKTIVAIRWAEQFSGRKIVLAPLTTLDGWRTELESEGIKKSQIHINKSCGFFEDGWYLTNYEAVRANKIISNINWSVIICDESTKLSNPKAEISRILEKDFAHVEGKAILSGMPAPESPFNYFQQFKFLYGEFMGFKNFYSFRNTLFFQPSYSKFEWIPKKGVEDKIKQCVHKNAFCRTRKEVGLEAIKVYEKRIVEPTAKQKKAYKEVESTFTYTGDDIEMITKWAIVKFIWLARIAGGFAPDERTVLGDGKTKELYNLITGELKGQKVVVWFRFNQELNYVKNFLKSKDIPVAYITGDSSFDNRNFASRMFTHAKVNVMLCQVKCGKYGLDWSVSSTAIYYSNAYDMEDRAQSEERILSVSKKEPLLYIDLITRGTIDSSISRILRKKYKDSRKFQEALVQEWLENKNA